MALYSNKILANGTHIISAGHASSNSRGVRGFERVHASLYLDVHHDNGLLTGTNNIYQLEGSAVNTELGSVIVYLNGQSLDETEYSINYEDKTIAIKRYITEDDDSLEVRSKEDSNYTIVDNVAILEVTPGFIEHEDLVHYAPSYGDEINLTRICGIHKNLKNSHFMRHVKNTKQTAYVLSHEIYEDAIYAEIKVRG